MLDDVEVKFSLVVPIYNDGYLADTFCKNFNKVFMKKFKEESLTNIIELIFVDDGSGKESILLLEDACAQYPYTTIIKLSRNFGQHNAIACGFANAKGRYVGRANVDLQDPLEYLPEMMGILEDDKNEVDLVVGQYEARQSKVSDKFSAYAYYAFFNLMTGLNVEQNTSALRVMNRQFLEAYNSLKEQTRFPQGLDLWLGFEHRYIKIEHKERIDGKSSYTFMKRLSLAFFGTLAFSDRPLKLVVTIGFVVVMTSFLIIASLILSKIFGIELLPGYVTSLVSTLISTGMLLVAIGAVGLYVGQILREVQQRPLYIIKKITNYNKGKS